MLNDVYLGISLLLFLRLADAMKSAVKRERKKQNKKSKNKKKEERRERSKKKVEERGDWISFSVLLHF